MKKEKIKEIFDMLPGHVTYIPVDLEVEKLEQPLAKNGYKTTIWTLFVEN